MRAWVCPAYGSPEVLQLAERPVPVPRAGEVLIRVLATTVSSGDARMRALRFPRGMGLIGRLVLGWNRPRRPVFGTEAAGEVVALGAGVNRFAIGDRVVAFPDFRLGAHAEYLTMPATGMIAPLPGGLALTTAAAICFGGLTAKSFLDRARTKRGERILIIGAGGTVGSAIAQLALEAGLIVTAQTSAAKVGQLPHHQAMRIIARDQTDFRTLGESWDIVADTVGASSFAECLPLLAPGGRYLAVAADLRQMLARGRDGRRIVAGPSSSTPADLARLAELAQTGAFRPLVDSVLPFDALPAAHAIVDSGRKAGSVVVRVAG
jgi:NADPH:quinone reductase-like Zn-dependent oxidoreductase